MDLRCSSNSRIVFESCVFEVVRYRGIQRSSASPRPHSCVIPSASVRHRPGGRQDRHVRILHEELHLMTFSTFHVLMTLVTNYSPGQNILRNDAAAFYRRNCYQRNGSRKLYIRGCMSSLRQGGVAKHWNFSNTEFISRWRESPQLLIYSTKSQLMLILGY